MVRECKKIRAGCAVKTLRESCKLIACTAVLKRILISGMKGMSKDEVFRCRICTRIYPHGE